MKGTISVNPVFTSFQIRKPQIYCKSPLVLWDGHRLYLHNNKISTRWQKPIINCAFSKQYKVLLVLCDDSRVYVFTQNLQLITKISWQSKYSVAFELLEHSQYTIFLMIGVSQIQVLQVNLLTNIKITKFLSSMKFQVERRQHIMCQQNCKLKWNKGYRYHLKQQLLYLWSLQDINFYSLPKLQLKSQIKNLSKKQLPITTVNYNFQYKYTITGLLNGNIKIWRLPMNKQFSQEYIMIHNFIHHTKSVQQIIQGVDYRFIISSSLDLTVCLSSLETFQLLRVYNFLGEYSTYAFEDDYIGLLTFGKVMDFIMEINSPIINFDKHYKILNNDINNSNILQSIQITLNSNIGFQLKIQNLKLKDLNKIQIQYIYPPLKAKSIMSIVSSPYINNQYFMLVENGQIFRLRIQNNSGKIQKSYNIQKVQDIQHHSLNQTPTTIKFLKVIPPQYDSQIIDNTLQKKQINYNLNLDQHYYQLKLITIGCNRGTIIFLNTQNIQKIYTRVTYHRQSIINMQSIYNKKQKVSYLISLCTQNYIKIVKFDYQKANCIHSIYCGSTLNFIKAFDNRLALVFQKGFFQIFQFNQKQQLYCLKNQQATDHQEQILVLDNQLKYKLILTASLDNKIKIWTYYKILIYQIYLDHGLKYALWTQNLQILVAHHQKILYLRKLNIKFYQGEIQDINQKLINSQDVIQLNIKQLCQSMNQRHQIKYKYSNKLKKSIDKFQQIYSKQLSLSPKLIKQSKTKKQLSINNKKQSAKQKNRKKIYSKVQQTQKKVSIPQSDIQAMNKHLKQMKKLKQKTNQSIFPKINNSIINDNNIFDNFMKSKLINKKILTRRDITLNRIIMKNIIKDHFGNDQEILGNLKLDF